MTEFGCVLIALALVLCRCINVQLLEIHVKLPFSCGGATAARIDLQAFVDPVPHAAADCPRSAHFPSTKITLRKLEGLSIINKEQPSSYSTPADGHP